MTYQSTRDQSGLLTIDSDHYQSESSQMFSVIDRHSSFDGTFRSDRDLRIDGTVKGAIECLGTLFVAQGASVDAKVEAENIDIAGELSGEIHCKGLLRLLPSGRLSGKVFTSQLIVNDGAIYEGNLEMKAPPPSRQASARTAPSVQVSPQQLISEAVAASAPQNGSDTPSTYVRRLGGPETPWSEEQATENAQPTSEQNH